MTKLSKEKQITVAEMSPHVHSFMSGENKVEKITAWLVSWIDASLKDGKIAPNYFLPQKAELAYHIGVSQGTIQTVFRRLEDLGYVASKQKVGTYILDRKNNVNNQKLTSKRDVAVEVIKQFIIDNVYLEGDILSSVRKISKISKVPNTTLQKAISYMVSIGILQKSGRDYIVKNVDFNVLGIRTQNLVDKVVQQIKEYILSNLKTGEKLPTNNEFTQMFGVSVKTVHDAIKILAQEGLVYIRRGQYGTVVADNSEEDVKQYNYEKIERKLRAYIIKSCKVGDKLPSIKDFAKKYNISEKTVKKALDILAEDGYLMFSRGRYGGTFVTDIPQVAKDAYKWLAISSDYVSNT